MKSLFFALVALSTINFSQAACKVYVSNTKEGSDIIKAAKAINAEVVATTDKRESHIGVSKREFSESAINLIGEESVRVFITYEISRNEIVEQATEPRFIESDFSDINQGVAIAVANICSDLIHIN